MKSKLFKTFRFSVTITIVSIILAVVMLRCSAWQWERYKEKKLLVETYKDNTISPALDFPFDDSREYEYKDLLHQKVKVEGHYDFLHQIIISNRKHATGPGFWLITPLRLSGTQKHVLVSRGFIPFADRSKESWEKYNFEQKVSIEAVVQPTVPARSFLTPRNPEIGEENLWQDIWLYPDLEKIAKQFPYEIITPVFLQKLGGPPNGMFPAESISIQVPPSTHFGYTIEWIILAIATLTIGFLLQAFPPKRFLKANLSCFMAIALLSSSYPQTALGKPISAKEITSEVGVEEKLNEQVDLNLSFFDELGNSVTISSLLIENRPIIIAPVYYHCPRLCTLTLNGVVDLINSLDLELGKDYSVISVSFNYRENKEIAHKRAKEFWSQVEDQELAPKGWRFLTGDADNIQSLMNQLGFLYKEQGMDFSHSTALMIITAEGKISRYIYGIHYPPDRVRLALVEAARGRIGSSWEKVFHYCFRFDPTKGKYSIVAMNLMQVVCLVVFGVLVIAIATLWYRD
jgi:protein SCO1